jgi:hypothetical protein
MISLSGLIDKDICNKNVSKFKMKLFYDLKDNRQSTLNLWPTAPKGATPVN